MKKYIYLIFILLLVFSCNRAEQEIPEENYESLFPFKGIEKPENQRDNMTVNLCDPELALENYKYPGEEEPSESDEYEVTLTCSFTEKNIKDELVKDPTAQYRVTYINDKKELVTVKSASATEADTESSEFMKNGEEKVISFKVKSGFPIYLSVHGVGPRGSSVKASIKATAADGVFEIPELKTEQYQNEEGPNHLQYPYCEYIILP